MSGNAVEYLFLSQVVVSDNLYNMLGVSHAGLRFAITYGVIAILSVLMLLVSYLDLSASKGGRLGVFIGETRFSTH